MSSPSNEANVLTSKLNEGFAALSELPSDVIKYALANMHGRMEYQIKYADRASFSIDILVEMMKGAAYSQTVKK